MPAPTTDTYALVDRLIDGGLPAHLAAARERGESYETIAANLRSGYDVVVSGETVRRWCSRATDTAEATS
ncbi:MAG: hypothetical protein H6515_12955 [Microthrixaceae bacterium]|nr:hypothetical protein [Microthrixaceae bacterium]